MPDRREGLVDLDQVEVGDRQALLVERLPDGVGRLGVQRVVGAGDVAVRADLGQPGQPELLGLRRLITTTAQAPSEIGEDVPAVIVPSAAKAGRSFASVSTVASRPYALVLGDDDRLAACAAGSRPE